jgi:hypothetical protein
MDNHYVARYTRWGSQTLRTDRHGAVLVRLRAEGLGVEWAPW